MNTNTVSPSEKYKTETVLACAEKVGTALSARFGEAILDSQIEYDFPVFTVASDSVIDVLEYLYKEDNLAFRFLTTLFATHYPNNKGAEFSITYQVHNMFTNERIRLKTYLPLDNPKVRTATGLYRTANWMERQEYDFFGVEFDGHPNLRRILNMDEMNYFPLRKEFPLEDGSREDKDNAFFGR